MKMSAVLRSIKAADIEYINNSAARSIPVMTTDVANIPPTIAPALYPLPPAHSCSLVMVMFFFKTVFGETFKQKAQNMLCVLLFFLFVHHSP